MARKKSKKWRPTKVIQTKVVGICINKGNLLAAEVYDDKGKVKGIRPLGGHIEFGETRETALKREFLEELGVQITTAGTWRCFENRYQHEGELGHEYIFAIGVSLADKMLYQRELITFSEDSGYECTARWFPVSELKSGSIALYPDGLLDKL